MDDTGLDLLGEFERPAEIAGEDRGGESVFDRIGDVDGLVHIVDRDDAHDRAEDFFLTEMGGWIDIGENGRGDEIAMFAAIVGQAAASGQQLGALAPGAVGAGDDIGDCIG